MTCTRHNLSSHNSRERKIWPARLRFACCRQRRGRWRTHNPGCRRTDRHLTNQTAHPSRRPGKAGKGPLPKRPGRVLYRAAADRRNTTRATIRESSRQAYRAGRSSPTTQLRKTVSACGLQCTPRMSPASVPAMCPVSIPVLSTCLNRCPGLRQPAATADDRSFQERRARQDRPERTDCRRRPPDGESSAGSQAQSLESEQ